MTLTLDQIKGTTHFGSRLAAQLKEGRDSILNDDDLLFVYTKQEVRSLASNAARFGDRPKYPNSELYMHYYSRRLRIMAEQGQPVRTRPDSPGLTWGPEYQLVADEW